MRHDGRYFLPEPTDRKPNPAPVFVTAPFRVAGEANDGGGKSWGLVLRWLDRDGREHEWSCPKRLVHGDGGAIAAELENAGLTCGTSQSAHEYLKWFIGAVRAPKRLRCVDRTGWHQTEPGPVFILPGGDAFGPGRGSVVMQRERIGGGEAFRQGGTLESWQRSVACYAVGNSRLALLISASFAGPLLDVVGEPSGGVHLFGKSQSGKTTLLCCAVSVWGPADQSGPLRSWRATTNGLEGVAAETCDTALFLDEMGEADGHEVAQATYMLANGGGKTRASRDGSARRRHTWRSVVLSTGEVPLAVKIAESGRRAMAGQEVRLVSLRSDARMDLGVFERIHDLPDAGALASHLREATRTHYGTAGRAFLAKLADERASDPEGLAKWIKALIERFRDENLPAGADGQVRSVCERFGLFAAAGELARAFGVLPWPENEAGRAATNCFLAWLAERGGAGASEDVEALRQVRAFIEANGTSRFEEIGGDARSEVRTINRVGFWRRVGDAKQFLILPQAWRNEVCRGLDHKRVAEGLVERNLLLLDSEGRPNRKETVPGYGRPRVYVVSGAILEADDE